MLKITEKLGIICKDEKEWILVQQLIDNLNQEYYWAGHNNKNLIDASNLFNTSNVILLNNDTSGSKKVYRSNATYCTDHNFKVISLQDFIDNYINKEITEVRKFIYSD